MTNQVTRIEGKSGVLVFSLVVFSFHREGRRCLTSYLTILVSTLGSSYRANGTPVTRSSDGILVVCSIIDSKETLQIVLTTLIVFMLYTDHNIRAQIDQY